MPSKSFDLQGIGRRHGDLAVEYIHLESQCANCQLWMSDKVLYNANSTRLDVLNSCDATLRYKQRSTIADLYVVHHVSTPLLLRDVIAKLDLLAKVDKVSYFVLLAACTVNKKFA